MRRICYGILSTLLVIALAGCGTPAENGTAFYISPSGSDSNPGTEGKPFATVSRARDAVRGFKKDSPVTVYLRGGRYELAEPVVFTPEDSGTEAAPITYAAYPGETPVISGGRAVTGLETAENGNWIWRLENLKILSDEWGVKSPVIIVLSGKPSRELERLVRMARADFFLPKCIGDELFDMALSQALMPQGGRG